MNDVKNWLHGTIGTVEVDVVATSEVGIGPLPPPHPVDPTIGPFPPPPEVVGVVPPPPVPLLVLPPLTVKFAEAELLLEFGSPLVSETLAVLTISCPCVSESTVALMLSVMLA